MAFPPLNYEEWHAEPVCPNCGEKSPTTDSWLPVDCINCDTGYRILTYNVPADELIVYWTMSSDEFKSYTQQQMKDNQ